MEEYQVKIETYESKLKENNKKYIDLQKKATASDATRKELAEKVKKLENEKAKLSEKWVKLSAKNKQEDK